MDILSNEKSIISDVINRVLNCREIKDLYVYGKIEGELEGLHPVIRVMRGDIWDDMEGEVVYVHIADRRELDWTISQIIEKKESKDFFLYISSDVEISNNDVKILGCPHYLEKYSALEGVLFLTGISFQLPKEFSVPDKFKVLAVIHFYNEADILEKTIRYLLNQEVDLYMLDNWSDDDSYEIAQKYKEIYPDRIYLEHFPLSGKGDNYEWYNQLEKTEMISRVLDYDWFIHYDADEMRISPWENTTLRKAIFWIDSQGYNCIENTVIDFRFTDRNAGNIFMKDTYFDFRHDKKMFDQLKTWKKSEKIDLKSSAGHFVHISDPKIYPLKFLNRHYPLRSMEQAEKKVFQDRLPRFRKEQVERGWHGHYNRFKRAEDFIYDRTQLLCWRPETFQELYIPLFMECGLRWNVNVNLAKMELPDIASRKIILYGAGNIGKRAYLELAVQNQITAWIDKQYEQLPAIFCEKVVSPQKILVTEYDFIVLAVKKTDLQREIKAEIIGTYGVPEEKILCVKTM